MSRAARRELQRRPDRHSFGRMFRPVLAVIVVLLALSALPLGAQDTPAARRAAIELMYPVMVKALEAGNFGQARNICDQAIVWEPENPVHYYNLACIEARAGPTRDDQAWEALARSIALGFREVETMRRDPDLAPLRTSPRFAHLEQAALLNAARREPVTSTPDGNGDAGKSARAASPAPLPGLARGVDLDAVIAAEPPAPARIQDGLPIGFYLMTRFPTYTNTAETMAWYFSPGGEVYRQLESGFSPEDLASHAGLKGTLRRFGDIMEVAWSDGRRSRGVMTPEGDGFTWDGASFRPAPPVTSASTLAGTYVGHEPISYTGNRAAIGRTLELRPDGSFLWRGVSLLPVSGNLAHVTTAANGFDTSGRWRAAGYYLVLVDMEGRILRRIACLDRLAPGSATRMFFGGTLYQRHD